MIVKMWKKLISVKVLFGCFNTAFFVCGVLEVVCGFLLLCDTRRVVLSRLLAAPDSALTHAPFYYVALALLVAGLSACAVAALGCWATYLPGYLILTFYFIVVLSLTGGEVACAALAAAWPRCAGLASARGGAVGALQAYYALPDYEHFTLAVDLAQTELECCGMTDARNYGMSVWQLRRLGPRGLAVPPTCCTQEPGAASHLNPRPLNESRCQRLQPDETYRHIPGCLGKIEDWYNRQYVIFLITLFAVAVSKLGLLVLTVFSCIRVKKRRHEIDSFVMRSKDNNTNENIYQSKMYMSHDEPITAKYIQPNNFYSPRVRNPRIFTDKPNEIV